MTYSHSKADSFPASSHGYKGRPSLTDELAGNSSQSQQKSVAMLAISNSIASYREIMQTTGQIPVRRFGKTDVQISALGLGGHHLGFTA